MQLMCGLGGLRLRLRILTLKGCLNPNQIPYHVGYRLTSYHATSAYFQSIRRLQQSSLQFLRFELVIDMNSQNFLMLEIHKRGTELTSVLQTSLDDYGGFMIAISKLFDPRYAYTVFFPILFHLNRPAGIKLLWTAAVAEWLNAVFKWMLFGERTYWWVLQNEHLWGEPSNVPAVRQFPITCETGPGSPSGHVMITCAVLYVFLQGLLELQGKKRNRTLHLFGWIVYMVTEISIATSRVFLAAHFPHQCVAGLILGVILGWQTNKVPVSKLHLVHHVGMAVGIVVLTLASYYGLIGLGVDPDWSIPLAQKWCANPSWVHLNTSPFYMMSRYTATVFGIGIALSTGFYQKSAKVDFGWKVWPLLTLTSILVAFACTSLIPEGPAVAVYCAAFVIHCAIPVIVMGIVPSTAATLGVFKNAAH